ncbi:MAG: LD-carboxypeptidase [Alphaproteobacteria bacterium]|nr:LD-carboxypeptidase [Alphaproteobacteria bacterium]
MKQIKKIALISPSVMLSERELNPDLWLEYFEKLKLNVVMMPTALSGKTLSTFQAKEKAKDIMKAYEDNSIDALIAVHGGASALRVLEYLDFDIIKKNKKPIVGFSDTTSLQFGIFGKTQNPYVTGFFPEYEFRTGMIDPKVDDGFRSFLTGDMFKATSGECVIKGIADGVLIGGNMSTISDLSGTPYYPDLTDKILLLEDECEKSYKLKLMLTQLKYNPTFEKIKGIIFGKFSECEDHITHGTVESVIDDFAAQVNVPMIKNFNYGHFKNRFVLTCGVRYKLDAGNCVLEQIEE